MKELLISALTNATHRSIATEELLPGMWTMSKKLAVAAVAAAVPAAAVPAAAVLLLLLFLSSPLSYVY